MTPLARRYSFVGDSLLAGFTSVIGYTIVLFFATTFSRTATLALLTIPALILSSYRRYRAATMCAGLTLIASMFEVVPPSGWFNIYFVGLAAFATFVSVAMTMIAVAMWLAKRRMAAQTSH